MYRIAVLAGLLATVCSSAGAWSSKDLGQQQLNMDFSDAQEKSGAMTFRVPTGWETVGTWQGTQADPRFVVKIVAPDHKMLIQLQDANLPELFLIPSGGLQAGQSLMLNGQRAVVAGYTPGSQMAKSYMDMLYGQNRNTCSSYQVTDVVAAPVPQNMWLPPHVDRRNSTGGFAFFVCTTSDGDILDGVAYVATVRVQLPNGQPAWAVSWIWHYLAAESMAQKGFLIARAVADSIRVNPEWMAQHVSPPIPPPSAPIMAPPGVVAPDVAGAYKALNDQQARFRRQMGQMAQQQDTMHNIMTDQTPTIHPDLGTMEMRPYTQGNTHCVDGLGRHIDTWAPSCPPGFTRLLNQ
jgi:hypothetical protein